METSVAQWLPADLKKCVQSFVAYYRGFTQLIYVGSIGGKTQVSFSIVSAVQPARPALTAFYTTAHKLLISWSVSHEVKKSIATCEKNRVRYIGNVMDSV